MNINDVFDGSETEINFYTTDTSQQISNEKVYGRILFLLIELKIKLPSWLKGKIPFVEELEQSKAKWSPLVTEHYRLGSSFGKGDLAELRELLDTLLHAEFKNYQERQKFHFYLESLVNGLFDTNVEKQMNEVEGESIPTFDTGFKALDSIQKGFYQGAFCFAANPGDGKTSVLLYTAACLAKQFPIWYFQTEIPASLIESRIKKDLNPEQWHKDSKFFAGNYSSASILSKIQKEPNPNRVILYDSPEIKDSGMDNLVYFEKTYQELVQIKLLSKAVFVTSQVKQNLGWDDLGVYSLNDSASKARYLDGIIYLKQQSGITLIKVAKNRFGGLGEGMVKFNMENLTVEENPLTELFN